MRSQHRSITLLAMLGLTGAVLAAASPDAPDSRVNVVSGAIETVDTPWSGSNYNVRHVTTGGALNALVVTTLTTDAKDDLGARLAINTNDGDTWVAWWRDGAPDQVIVRRRVSAEGTWTPERVQSDPSVGSRHPSVAFDGTQPWVAYEADAPTGGTAIEVKMIEDDPMPFVTATVVANTEFTGNLDTLIQVESDRLWVTWVDSATQVAWSSYDTATGFWSVPSFESYATDSVAEARLRIRTTLIGN